ncbi:hypothetical protein Tco_0716771 [Tanacetum coccineum]
MEMIQQLFMAAFATFVLSIVVEKLACVAINGDEWKSKKTIVHSPKSKSKKKVRFALHDQIAIVVNNKLVKLDPIKPAKKKQTFGPTSYDLDDVCLGANWMGEELMMHKELGLHILPDDKAQGWLRNIDDNIDYQTEDNMNYKVVMDFDPKDFIQ